MKLIIIYIIILSFLKSAPYFDEEKAYNYLLKQCEFGVRYPGSQGHINFKNYLSEFLENKGDTLIVEEHNINHPYLDKKIALYNLFVRFNIESDYRVLLLAHWDTREIADKDQSLENVNKPIMGANDGASGIAILMQLTEILNANPIDNIGVDILFVDGEDMGRHGDLNNFSIGTKLFAKGLKNPIPKFSICLDMVADKDPQFKIEYFSYLQAKEYVLEIWDLANSLGYKEFSYDITGPIYDDHRALYLETGIPSLDIIDFDYPYWHTLEDTPDKCSAKTMGIVGNVVVEYLYSLGGYE